MVNPPRSWEPIQGILEPEVIRQFGGVSSMDAFSLDDNIMVKNKNISTKDMPAAKVRGGFVSLGTLTAYPTGIGSWKENQLHVVSGGVWRRWSGSAWEDLLSSLSIFAKWSFTNFKGNFPGVYLVAANGVDPAKVYDGNTVSNLVNAPEGLNYVTSHENRLYGAVGNALHYSALRNAQDWNTVDQSGQIVIENNGGEDISCVIAGTGKVVVFLPHSMHELYGTGPLNYRLQLLTDDIGCVNHQSAVMLGGVLYFLSHNGLFRYAGGSLPSKDFSFPIQSMIERINPAGYSSVCAGTDGERYYISLPIDGATEPNVMLEYDPTYNLWNMWEIGGKPCVYGRSSDKMYIGTLNNKLLQQGGNDDAGTPIPYMVETKPFASGTLAANSRLYRLWIVADVPIGSTMNVSISNEKDGDTSWTLVKTITAHEDVRATPIYIPVDKSFFSNWLRIKVEGVGPVTIHEISRQSRVFRFGIGGV